MASPPPWASKTHSFFIIFSMRFLIDFCSLLARFSLPTCLPKTIKIYQKSMPRGNPSWASIFHRFLVGFCSQLRPQKPQKSLKFHWFYKYFCKIGLSKLTSIFDRFWSQLASILDQKINQKSFENPSPEASKKWSKFWWIFEPSWLHFGSQVGAMLATFLNKKGGGIKCSCLFFGKRLVSIFSPSWPHLGPIWPSFSRLWAELGRGWASMLKHFLH